MFSTEADLLLEDAERESEPKKHIQLLTVQVLQLGADKFCSYSESAKIVLLC